MDAGEITMVGAFAIPIVAIICYYCHETIVAWHEVSLKRDMVARGYSASEIVDVVSGEHSGTSALGQVPPAKPIKQPA